jgi:hypothetical protein
VLPSLPPVPLRVETWSRSPVLPCLLRRLKITEIPAGPSDRKGQKWHSSTRILVFWKAECGLMRATTWTTCPAFSLQSACRPGLEPQRSNHAVAINAAPARTALYNICCTVAPGTKAPFQPCGVLSGSIGRSDRRRRNDHRRGMCCAGSRSTCAVGAAMKWSCLSFFRLAQLRFVPQLRLARNINTVAGCGALAYDPPCGKRLESHDTIDFFQLLAQAHPQ